MQFKSSLAAAALAALVSIAHAQGASGTPAAPADVAGDSTRDPAFVTAMELYRAGRWSPAYGRFIVLADGGNVEAARVALLMLRHGRELFGTEWSAAPSEVTAWEKAVRSAEPLRVSALGE